MGLADKKCKVCEMGMPTLKNTEAAKLLKELNNDWKIKKGHVNKKFRTKNFIQAMKFVNEIAKMAEAQGHHPNIIIIYNKIIIDTWTHVIKGLDENDFIIAAKIEKLFKKYKV